MKLKKLIVATPSSSARMIELPRIQRAPAADRAVLRRCAGRLLDLHPAQEERRPEEREAVERERVRAFEQCDERPAEAVADEERERAAAVHEAVRLDVVVTREHGLEQRAERHVEEHAQRAGAEGDDVELRPGEVAERVRDRDGDDQQRAQDVRRQHQLPSAAPPVDPGPGVQGEEQVGDQIERRQHAHLPGRRVEGEHRRRAAARAPRSGRRSSRRPVPPRADGTRRCRAGAAGSRGPSVGVEDGAAPRLALEEAEEEEAGDRVGDADARLGPARGRSRRRATRRPRPRARPRSRA